MMTPSPRPEDTPMGWKLATILMNILGGIGTLISGIVLTLVLNLQATVATHLGEHKGLFDDDWRQRIQENRDRIIRLEAKTEERLLPPASRNRNP